MIRTDFTNLAIAAIAFASFAVGGDLTMSNQSKGVRLYSSLSTGCGPVHCEQGNSPIFSYTTPVTPSILLAIPPAQPVSPSYRVSQVATLLSTGVAPSPAVNTTMPDTENGDSSTLIFNMAGGRIVLTPTGWVDADTGASVNQRPTRSRIVNYGDNEFPDPVVNQSFNTYSTTIANSGAFVPPQTPAVVTNLSFVIPVVATDPKETTTGSNTPSSPIAPIVSSIPPGDLTTAVGAGAATGGLSTSSQVGTAITTNVANTSPVTPSSTPADPTTGDPAADDPTLQAGGGVPNSDTPEPATGLLIGAALAAAGLTSRKRR